MPQFLLRSLKASAAGDGWARELVGLAGVIGPALLVALVLRTVLVQPFTIPSDSMEPTLLKGDYILVSKPSYGWSRWSIPFAPPLFRGRILGQAPRRGDIVVFKRPGDEGGETVVKRLIGLPGDRVQLVGGQLYLNGVPVRRADLGPAADADAPERQVRAVREAAPGGRPYTTLVESPDHYGETTGVYVVPQGGYFVLGDNRDNSLDSRWPAGSGMGFVPAEDLVGRVELIAASWRGGASLLKPWTWVVRFDPSRVLRRPG